MDAGYWSRNGKRHGNCFIFLSLLLPIALSGCGAGAAGLIIGILSISGGGGGGTVIEVLKPPLMDPPSRVDGDHVLVSYDLFDAEGATLDVQVEWRPAAEGIDRPFAPAREFKGEVATSEGSVRSDGTEGLQVPPNQARKFHFVWDARPDLRDSDLRRSAARVEVRVTSIDKKTGQRVDATSGPFLAGNDRPRIVSMKPLDDKGSLPLAVRIFDSTSDTVRLTASFSEGDGGAWKKMSLIGATPSTLFETLPGEEGKENLIIWKSDDSAGGLGAKASDEVFIEVVPSDLETGEGLRIRISVDNNTDPVIQIVDVAGSPDRSFEVPIRIVVRDEEENPVSVLLQWAEKDVPFPEPPLGDPALLKRLLAGDPGLEAMRKELHILSEAPPVLRGQVDDRRGLGANQVRVTDLVRKGLVFRPPAQSGPRDLGGFPFKIGSDVFLIGQEIRFFKGRDEPAILARVIEFDPRDSRVTLDRDLTLEPPVRYEIEARRGLADLPSALDGMMHTFVWDSLKDVGPTGVALDTTIRIRAIGIDSQVGPPSAESVFDLESGPLILLQTLATDSGPSSAAIGDVDGNGQNDIVIANKISMTACVFKQTFEHTFDPNATQKLQFGSIQQPEEATVSIGDVDGDAGGLQDVVIASFSSQSHKVEIYLQEGGRLGKTPDGGDLAGPHFSIESLAKPSSVCIADVLGHARNQILVASESGRSVSIFEKSDAGGDPPFEEVLALPAGSQLPSRPQFITVGDVNADGFPDILVASFNLTLPRGSRVTIFPGDPEGRFTSPSLLLMTGERPSSIALGDVDGDRASDVVVTNEGSDSACFYLGPISSSPEPPIEPSMTLRADSQPTSVKIGDLNGDGREDVVLANQLAGTASVYLQTASGELPATPSQTLGKDLAAKGQVPSLALGDVNGDRLDDIVMPNFDSALANIFLQTSSGFIVPSSAESLVTDGRPLWVSIGDLNGDGRNDVAAVTESGKLDIYLQRSSGALPSSPSAVFLTGTSPVVLAVGDLDGDGGIDIAVANESPPGVSLYHQTGSGGLGAVHPGDELPGADQEIALESPPSFVAIGDLNGDGRNDLAVAIPLADTLQDLVDLYLQEDSGRQDVPGKIRSDPIPLTVGENPVSLAIGDLNGDGRDDLVVVNQGKIGLPDSRTAMIYYQGDPDSLAETAPLILAVPLNTKSCAIGDLNGDGRNDLAVLGAGQNLMHIYLQSDEGKLQPPQVSNISAYPNFMTTGDLNGDGWEDVLITSYTDAKVTLFLQDPSIGGIPANATRRFSALSGAKTAAIGDLNGDGRNDIVVVNGYATTLSVFLAR